MQSKLEKFLYCTATETPVKIREASTLFGRSIREIPASNDKKVTRKNASTNKSEETSKYSSDQKKAPTEETNK